MTQEQIQAVFEKAKQLLAKAAKELPDLQKSGDSDSAKKRRTIDRLARQIARYQDIPVSGGDSTEQIVERVLITDKLKGLRRNW